MLKSKRAGSQVEFKNVYTGDSLKSGGEWIEVSYLQSRDFGQNMIWVYYNNEKLSFEKYLEVMGGQMTYPLYLQKVRMEGDAVYTVKKDEGGSLNMSMSAGTLNRSFAEMARWIMPIRYGTPTQNFGISDSVMFKIQFRRTGT